MLKNKTYIKIGIILTASFFLCTCSGFVSVSYAFNNQTEYYITIYLDHDYYIESLSYTAKDKIELYPKSYSTASSKTVTVYSENVKFIWSTGTSSGISGNNDSQVICDVSGNTASFRRK